MPEEIETTGEEIPTVDEEFRELSEGAQAAIDKLNGIALKMEKAPRDPVTRKELVEILRILSGDFGVIVKDTIAASGGALNELYENLAADDDDDEDEDGEGGIDGTTVEIYLTLKSNREVFAALANAPGLAEADQNKLLEMVKLNQGSIDELEESFGDALKEAAEERVKEVQEAISGASGADQ